MIMKSMDTTIECRNGGQDGVVEIRYLAPVTSDWLREEYPLEVLRAFGWRTVVPDEEPVPVVAEPVPVVAVASNMPMSVLFQWCHVCGMPAAAYEHWSSMKTGQGICSACFDRQVAIFGFAHSCKEYGIRGAHHSIN